MKSLYFFTFLYISLFLYQNYFFLIWMRKSKNFSRYVKNYKAALSLRWLSNLFLNLSIIYFMISFFYSFPLDSDCILWLIPLNCFFVSFLYFSILSKSIKKIYYTISNYNIDKDEPSIDGYSAALEKDLV